MDSRGVNTERFELVPCVEHELGRAADAKGEKSARVLQSSSVEDHGKEYRKQRRKECKGCKNLLVLGRLISQIQVLLDLIKIHPSLEIIVLPFYHVVRRSRVENSALDVLMHVRELFHMFLERTHFGTPGDGNVSYRLDRSVRLIVLDELCIEHGHNGGLTDTGRKENKRGGG